MLTFSGPVSTVRCALAIRKVCAACPSIEFILQCNVHTKPLWKRLCEGAGRNGNHDGGVSSSEQVPPSNLSLLYDESMGLGVACEAWRPPIEGVPCGYAGGLAPENIKEQVRAYKRHTASQVRFVGCIITRVYIAAPFVRP